jgi:DeoR/GlpR family transcriptional regulator of sugar metabolism
MAMRNGSARAEFILHELMRAGEVSVEGLCSALQVDGSTIRRDLEKLERQHLLKRIHGGAVQVDALSYTAYTQDLTFQENMGRQVEEKTRIALAAARLIQPGDTVALSPGTTTTHLARAIRQLQIQNLTVVTNAVNIAMELAGQRTITLLLTGGVAMADFFALVGPMAEHNLSELYTDKAFVGMHGVSVEHGLTGPNPLEALTYRVTMQHARQTIVLADHTKIGRVALCRIAPATAMQMLITDREAPPEVLEGLAARGVHIQSV